MNRTLSLIAFAAGLLALAWVGAGYVGNNLLALAMTGLIAGFYLMGALELRRFHLATGTLQRALQAIPQPLAQLGDWLGHLHPSLHQPVRLRVAGERVALPGPAMVPYLLGLLVLLGMLGTFLGMVVTLHGTVQALDSTADLQAMRAALAAPVKGLGLAFGTSIAGVCASAMLGLISAWARRERAQVGLALDSACASTLHPFSAAFQREQLLAAAQAQAQALPQVATQLQTLMDRLDQQQEALQSRLLTGQAQFHSDAQASYRQLAQAVGQALEHSLVDSARAAAATLQPAVQATLDGLARETTALQQTLGASVQQQLQGLSARFELSVSEVAQRWTDALAQQDRAQQAQTTALGAALNSFNAEFEQRAGALVDAVEAHHARREITLAGSLDTALQHSSALQQRLADTTQSQLEAVARRLDAAVHRVASGWQDAQARQDASARQQAELATQSLTSLRAGFEQSTSGLLAQLQQAQTELHSSLAAGDEARLAGWTDALRAQAAALLQQWQQAGEQTLARQQQICATLEQTAREISHQTGTQARETVTHIDRVMQAAAEAPRAAAEVMGALRQQLSDSMVRDNAMLDERNRLLATLGGLLDGVNHASTEQRAAVDALVASSASLLAQVGTQFSDQVQAESGKLGGVAAQLTASAVEVASLGESLGAAVAQFGETSVQLAAQLQRIEAALDATATRSDEQLAYYVAQARELIDLSLLSQKQIVDDLQRLARPAAETA
jgi:hypothetical protein